MVDNEWMKTLIWGENTNTTNWGILAKPGGNGQSEYVENEKKKKRQKGSDFSFNLLIFVKFDMFTIHILRNYYEKIE